MSNMTLILWFLVQRVQFRQKLLEKRLMEKKVAILKEAQEEEDRKKRLDALRKQVSALSVFMCN